MQNDVCKVCGLRVGEVTAEQDWLAYMGWGNAKTGLFEDRLVGECPGCGREVEVCPCGDPMLCECEYQDELSLEVWEVVPWEVFRPKTEGGPEELGGTRS